MFSLKTGICITCCPCFDMSYIAIGLNKSGCQFGMPSCIGIMSSSLGRYVAGFLSIFEHKDKLQIPNPNVVFDLYTKISNGSNIILPMGVSITCCIGGYLCHTLPLSRLRTEARMEYGIEVYFFYKFNT